MKSFHLERIINIFNAYKALKEFRYMNCGLIAKSNILI